MKVRLKNTVPSGCCTNSTPSIGKPATGTALAFVKEGEHFYYYNLQFLSDLNAQRMNPDLLYQVAGQLNEAACLFKRTTGLSLLQYAGWLIQLKPHILRNLPAGPKLIEQALIRLRSYVRQLGAKSGREKERAGEGGKDSRLMTKSIGQVPDL